MCSTADLLDNGHLELAAKADGELMWLATAIWEKAGYHPCAFTEN
jgi:hypothetical protein